MGAFIEQDGEVRFVNGEPNPLNILIWDIAMQGLAHNLVDFCDGRGARLRLKKELKELIQSTCQSYPNISKEQILDLWMIFIGFLAPFEEAEEFVSFYSAGLKKIEDGETWLFNVFHSLLMHPYFLLQQ